MSPVDEFAYFEDPPEFIMPEYEFDEVHISCTFTCDKSRAEQLAEKWSRIGKPVLLGGPAYDDRGGEFIPGRYLKQGCVITSRGCPGKCWFCDVWRREGPICELPITEGYVILDNNLLACSETHVRAVFNMLSRQEKKARFSGGLEAALLKPWHVDLFYKAKPKTMYFAYDTPDDYEPLVEAGKMLLKAGFTTRSHTLCAYVLIGYPKDTMEGAEKRLLQTIEAGFVPFAMLYKDKNWHEDKEWHKFQRTWVRPEIIFSKDR